MTKIDNFKSFVRRNPNLITYVREKNTSWQELYELYDLYGEDPTIWNKYLNKEEKRGEESSNNNPLNNILTMAKNIDTDKLQDGLSSIQKAVDLFGGLLVKDKGTSTKSDYLPRQMCIRDSYYSKEYEKGLQLYTNGVLIMDKCSELLPDYFSFVRGVIDTEDIPLRCV